MRTLILGGAGYIGGLLTDILIFNKYLDFTVYDSLLFHDFYKKNVHFINGDIRDTTLLKQVIEEDNYDLIVNLAAHVGDGACNIDPAISLEINRDCVKWLSENFNGRIIFTSSCSVYGKNNDLITEESPTNPLSLYAYSKVEAEKYLKDKNALILRLGTLYGTGDLFNRPRLDLVGNLLVFKALFDKQLTVYGGKQYRPILHVVDVAFLIAKQILTEGKQTGIYNLGGENLTILEMAKRVKSIINFAEIIETDIPTEDQRNYSVNDYKARKELGFENKFVYEKGIEDMLIFASRIRDWKNPLHNNEKWFKLAKPYLDSRFPEKENLLNEVKNIKLTSVI